MIERLLRYALVPLIVVLPGLAGAADKPLTGYTVIVLEPLAVEKSDATKDFQDGWEVILHKGMVQELQKKKLFKEISDLAAKPASGTATAGASGTQAAAPPAPVAAQAAAAGAAGDKRMTLSSTLVLYDKGSRTARFLVGMGAGAAKTRIRYVFRDTETGRELLRTEREGKFSGWLSSTGGANEEAIMESAGDVVDRLVDDIKKNR